MYLTVAFSVPHRAKSLAGAAYRSIHGIACAKIARAAKHVISRQLSPYRT